MAAEPIPFRKMNGLGNTFLVVDSRVRPIVLPGHAIMMLGQANSIGFDQMITIERSKKGADAFMRIHNRDGGEVDACGNATRCVGWLLMGETGRKPGATIETNAGLLRAFETGKPEAITVDMGEPRFRLGRRDARSPKSSATPAPSSCRRSRSTRRILHFALGCEHGQPPRHLLGRRASTLMTSPASARFSKTTRSSPTAPTSRWRRSPRARSIHGPDLGAWRRALTLACGTAACAVAVAAARKKLTERSVVVTPSRGPLSRRVARR